MGKGLTSEFIKIIYKPKGGIGEQKKKIGEKREDWCFINEENQIMTSFSKIREMIKK